MVIGVYRRWFIGRMASFGAFSGCRLFERHDFSSGCILCLCLAVAALGAWADAIDCGRLAPENVGSGETLILTGEHAVREPIVLKSNMTLVLDGAHLTLAEGTFTNMFRADFVTNVTLVGRNGATADGGVYNGLGEKTAKALGKPIWLNNTLLFTNVKGFRVEGIRFVNQRWWALNFIGCSQGVIRNLDFLANHETVFPDGAVTNVVSRRWQGRPKVRNADGVDIRCGCHDILIENITGFTQDDSVALTALTGGHENGFLSYDVPRTITDVTVRNVHTTSMCANVRLLAQGGAQMHRITVENVEDTSDGKTYLLGRGERTVNVGDNHEYRAQNRPGDMTDIVIRNIRSRAEFGVHLRGHAENVTVENVVGFDGCPRPFSDQRLGAK